MAPTKYIVLCGQVVGSGPFNVEYNWDHKQFDRRSNAISHGFEIRGSDDFNIGVLRDGQLVSLDWMNDLVVDSDPALMSEISKSIGL